MTASAIPVPCPNDSHSRNAPRAMIASATNRRITACSPCRARARGGRLRGVHHRGGGCGSRPLPHSALSWSNRRAALPARNLPNAFAVASACLGSCGMESRVFDEAVPVGCWKPHRRRSGRKEVPDRGHANPCRVDAAARPGPADSIPAEPSCGTGHHGRPVGVERGRGGPGGWWLATVPALSVAYRRLRGPVAHTLRRAWRVDSGAGHGGGLTRAGIGKRETREEPQR